MSIRNKSILAVPFILGQFIILLSFSAEISAYAQEGDSGIPGDYTQYVSMSEATPYPEPEVITVPFENGEELYIMEEPALSEEEAAELERERLEAENTVIISTLDEFNTFAANCSDKMWSLEKKVYLEADIDLGNEQFTPIAYFAGELYGNRHTVSGLNVSGNYARGGLFATLAKSAYISELKVKGSVSGTGKSIVGGIAGENYGTMQNVIFEGTVVSEYTAGGIAGLNLENAYITDSKSGGAVTAPTCAGGIAADNRGKLLSCENHAVVSTGTTGFNKIFERKDNIGMISGFSSGKEEQCVNLSASSTSLITIDRQKFFFTGLVVCGVAFLSGAVALIVLLFSDDKKKQ
ncbi:MAG: hypothetical protein Q4F31_02935 [Eubacteriales bacterium]|nr:hypothetical protein [Eubacteriales bacterium]